jgi:endonuclease-3
MALMKHIPKQEVHIAHHWLILHGRYICKARKPECARCGLFASCRHFSKYPFQQIVD